MNNLHTQNHLQIFASNAASANVTMAYTKLFKKEYSKVLAYSQKEASSIYKQHIPEYMQNDKNIIFLHTDIVVTGTSGIDANYELEIIIKAKKANVKKIITIVDNVANFNMRFTTNNKLLEKRYLPDEIWVFDSNFKSDIEYFNTKILYKENIYKKFLKIFYEKNPPMINNKFINNHQGMYLVILTEYIYELHRLKYDFNEYNMLISILSTIDKLNLNIPIFLKLHPREHQNKFNIILRKYSHLNIMRDNCNIQELIYYSKVIFGVSTSVFMECNTFKKPYFSILIDSNKTLKPPFIKSKNIIYTYNHLKKILKKYF